MFFYTKRMDHEFKNESQKYFITKFQNEKTLVE